MEGRIKSSLQISGYTSSLSLLFLYSGHGKLFRFIFPSKDKTRERFKGFNEKNKMKGIKSGSRKERMKVKWSRHEDQVLELICSELNWITPTKRKDENSGKEEWMFWRGNQRRNWRFVDPIAMEMSCRKKEVNLFLSILGWLEPEEEKWKEEEGEEMYKNNQRMVKKREEKSCLEDALQVGSWFCSDGCWDGIIYSLSSKSKERKKNWIKERRKLMRKDWEPQARE